MAHIPSLCIEEGLWVESVPL